MWEQVGWGSSGARARNARSTDGDKGRLTPIAPEKIPFWRRRIRLGEDRHARPWMLGSPRAETTLKPCSSHRRRRAISFLLAGDRRSGFTQSAARWNRCRGFDLDEELGRHQSTYVNHR